MANNLFGHDTPLLLNPDHAYFEGSVPVIAGVGVSASARGWRPAYEMLPDSIESGAPVQVDLTLLPPIQVHGRIRTPEGLPPRSLRIDAYTGVHTDVEGFRRTLLRSGGGYTAAYGPGGKAQVTFRVGASTDKEGRFSIAVKDEGQTVLVVWEAGFVPLFHPLGVLQSTGTNSEDIELTIGPPDSQGSVRLLMDGKPLANQQLFLSDLTLRDVQPAKMIPIDGGGRVFGEWFGRGREYGLGIQGPMAKDLKDRFLVWNGQTEVELASLPLATDVLSR